MIFLETTLEFWTSTRILLSLLVNKGLPKRKGWHKSILTLNKKVIILI